MNPNPNRTEHVLSFDGSTSEPELGAALDTAEYYRLKKRAVNRVVDEVRKAVGGWKREASLIDLAGPEVQRMESVFSE
jgi:serine/threonine-protein kinase HipA